MTVLVVDTGWLADHLADPALVIVDVRPSDQYTRGHIPGAISWDTFLKYHWADTSPAGIDLFTRVMEYTIGQLGIANDSRVVVYGDALDHQAARGVWMLHWLGNRNASALDGGFKAWTAAGGDVSTEPRRLPAVPFRAAPDPELVATYEQIRDRLDNPAQFVLDTRTPQEYTGEHLRATRGGRIPGSVNLPYQQNLDESGKLKDLDELRALYAPLGLRPDQEIVTVCHGGYRSAHTWMVLRMLGYERVRSYLGSWQEWGDRIDLPIER